MARKQASKRRWHGSAPCILITTLLVLATPIAQAQRQSQKPPEMQGMEELNKYPGLLPAVGETIEKLQREVQFPPVRRQSDLLPLLPESTIAYLALPNYGASARQALAIFNQELDHNQSLRAWWTRGEMAATGPKIEEAIQRFSEVSEYLGDEVVFSGTLPGKDPEFLAIAAVRKPGLELVLQKMIFALPTAKKPKVRILRPEQLASTREGEESELLILVRPDFVLASTKLSVLRSFSDRLNQRKKDFASSPFGQRILRSYAEGVSAVGAVDLQRLVALAPKQTDLGPFRSSGFADVKYAVWEHKEIAGRGISRSELSFTGPRHGAAAWLGSPEPLHSLEFVSPKALLAASIVLSKPSQIFEDIKQMSASNPNALASVMQMQQMLGVDLQQDILSQLSGEIAIAIQKDEAGLPAFTAVVGVKDSDQLHHTIDSMLERAHVSTEQFESGGITYFVVHGPSPNGTGKSTAFAFMDGYLLIGSSESALMNAVQFHRSGESLAKSPRFQAALPPARTGASAVLYYDQLAMTAMRMQQFAPDLATTLLQNTDKTNGAVVCLYGEKDAIVEASATPGMDVGVVLIGAAIAIPNLLRARVAANEAAAVGKLRTMNTAQITYATAYPDRGFASDLASLGTAPDGAASAEHAGFIDGTFANATCADGRWCVASGYKFMIKASCGLGSCRDFVAVATPVSNSSGNRSFCSTSDAVIRYQFSAPLTVAPAVRECKTWKPLR